MKIWVQKYNIMSEEGSLINRGYHIIHIEMMLADACTNHRNFNNELKGNEVYYQGKKEY